MKELFSDLLLHRTGQRYAMARVLAKDAPSLLGPLDQLIASHEGSQTLRRVQRSFVQSAVLAQAAASWVGRRVGPYLIDSMLGCGGMGEVYLASRVDGQFERRVAIKCMRCEFDPQTLLPWFENERRVLARLDHPQLARIIDGGFTPQGQPYFVMEYVDGEPLDIYCRNRGLDLRDRMQLFLALCEVVDHIHARGVVHSDIKFDNILVTPDGVLKLVDFGIARLLEADGDTCRRASVDGMQPCTLAYASPEQVAGEGRLTFSADIYSLGVVLYRLLTDESPYLQAEKAGHSLPHAICAIDPPLPSSVMGEQPQGRHRQVKGDLDAIAMKALQKDPSRRYDCAASLADDIRRYLESLPVRARQGGWVYRMARFASRRRRLVSMAACGGSIMVAALWAASQQANEARRRQQEVQQSMAQVRELSHLLVFDVSGEIERLPGTTSARKLAVEKGLGHLRDLAAKSSESPELTFEIAAAHVRIGEGQGRFGDHSSGSAAEADRNFGIAQSLLESTLARIPSGSPLARKMNLLLSKALGYRQELAVTEFGDRVAAQRFVDLKQRIYSALADPQGKDIEAWLGVANTLNQNSWLHDEDPSWYRRDCDAALERLEALKRQYPDHKGVNSILANVLLARSMHETAYDSGVRGAREALSFARRSKLMYEELNTRYAREVEYVMMLSEVDSVLGIALGRMGSFRDASRYHQLAIERLDRLVALEPANVSYRLERSIKHTNFSRTALAAGHARLALAQSREALGGLTGLDPGMREAWDVIRARFEGAYQMALVLTPSSRHFGQGPRNSMQELCNQWREAGRLLPAMLRRGGRLNRPDDPGALQAGLRQCNAG